jgi:hypothetical protein
LEEKKELAVKKETAVGVELRNLQDIMSLAGQLAKSTMVPKQYVNQPGNIVAAIVFGQELGLKPMQSLQNIASINGTPSIWGDAALALVEGSGLCEVFEEDMDRKNLVATCITKRYNRKAIERRYSMEDAERAGLTGKDNWKKNPFRMLQMRARSWALRDAFPDVLKGISIEGDTAEYQQEELNVTPTATVETAPVEPEPDIPDIDRLIRALDEAMMDGKITQENRNKTVEAADKPEIKKKLTQFVDDVIAKLDSIIIPEPKQEELDLEKTEAGETVI